MAILKLSAPWQIYYKELCELFKFDEEVRIVYDTEEQVINIYVDNAAKADAMYAVLPTEKDFGGIVVQINVIQLTMYTIIQISFVINICNNSIIKLMILFQLLHILYNFIVSFHNLIKM